MTGEEFIRGLKDPRVHCDTGYHGKLGAKGGPGFERVDSETGAVVTEVEPIGDSGMPRFLPDGTVEFRDAEGEVMTSGILDVHKSLAARIKEEGLCSPRVRG